MTSTLTRVGFASYSDSPTDKETTMEEKTCTITRVYRESAKRETVATDVSLEEARAHCSDPSTSCDEWMDVYSVNEDEE